MLNTAKCIKCTLVYQILRLAYINGLPNIWAHRRSGATKAQKGGFRSHFLQIMLCWWYQTTSPRFISVSKQRYPESVSRWRQQQKTYYLPWMYKCMNSHPGRSKRQCAERPQTDCPTPSPLHFFIAHKMTKSLRGTLVKAKGPLPTPKQRNVVYHNPCSNCPNAYVGQTSQLSTHVK